MELISEDYKKAFNLGYELAKELGLNSPIFKNQNESGLANNPIQAGMIQFIGENQNNLVVKRTLNTIKSGISNKNNGQELIP